MSLLTGLPLRNGDQCLLLSISIGSMVVVGGGGGYVCVCVCGWHLSIVLIYQVTARKHKPLRISNYCQMHLYISSPLQGLSLHMACIQYKRTLTTGTSQKLTHSLFINAYLMSCQCWTPTEWHTHTWPQRWLDTYVLVLHCLISYGVSVTPACHHRSKQMCLLLTSIMAGKWCLVHND